MVPLLPTQCLSNAHSPLAPCAPSQHIRVRVSESAHPSPCMRVRISESAYPSPPDTGSDAAVSRSSLSRAPGADARPHAPTRIMSDTDSDADCRPHPSLLRPTGARGRAKMNSPGRGPLCWYKRGGPLCWYERFFSRLSLFHALGLDCAIITLHTLMSSGPPTRQTKFKLSLGLMFCN